MNQLKVRLYWMIKYLVGRPLVILLPLVLGLSTVECFAGNVEIKQNQLFIDGHSQPQLWGAEIQYFRLRGGNGRNIPRQKVIALWARALDAAVAAKMNTVSFYTPWDFHEYAAGKFDFDGTVDEDGDGNADYPSRDVKTFIQMILERGIRHIMARPGPFINAEWGFLGFGAIPLWFHEKYPNSHARNSKGQRTPLYNYHDPDFLKHSQIWLEAVYRQVLQQHIGPGRPISFVQIDNETNFMWQSIYSHDYSPVAIRLYREFLKVQHTTIENLNSRHGRHWRSWEEILAPTAAGQNISEDQDWYRFQDYSIYSYLKKIRKIWENLGLTEPRVLFTLAESYNATENGLLPNYKLRNSRDTGMMTVNLYPKTYETPDRTLMNLPFKSDHDVKAADTASDFYLGRKEEWLMGPEIQGGWWKGVHVSEESRRQTYLTTLGHGLKGLFIYYFHEGDNWQHDWMKKSIRHYFDNIKNNERYRKIPEANLPDSFWNELNAVVANQFMAVDTRNIWRNGGSHPEKLYFDAPLGPDALPRAPYRLIRELGEKIIAPHGSFLAQARALEDPVCIIKDVAAHAPSPVPGINSRIVQSDWNAGLLGLLMHTGVNAKIHHWGLNSKTELLNRANCQLVVYQDTGFATAELVNTLLQVLDQGGSVLSFIHTGLASRIQGQRPKSACTRINPSPMDVDGYRCQIGKGTLYHAKVSIYDVFNTDFYHQIHDARERSAFINGILNEMQIVPQVRINGGGDRTVAFARTDPAKKIVWITVKTSRREGFNGRIQWAGADTSRSYEVSDVLRQKTIEITGNDLALNGFRAELADSGSTVFFVSPMPILKPETQFEKWLTSQSQISRDRMLRNISPPNTAPGIVIASPSQEAPNYFFHWTRDASLVINSVVPIFEVSRQPARSFYLKTINDFISLSRQQQLASGPSGLGEPRYLADGSVDTTEWARPQNDGSALRVLTLLNFLKTHSKSQTKVRALEVIRTDLEYVIQTWRLPCFDLWEEVRGHHFYTQSVQYSALHLAAKYFKGEGEIVFANRLEQEALLSQIELEKYWDEKRAYIGASRNLEGRPNFPNYKDENLDTSVLLASLHGATDEGILSFTDSRLLATANALEQVFAKEYSVQGIGRFTDDVYFGGNPWYLTTAAFAEFYYRVANSIVTQGGIMVSKNNIAFLRAVFPTPTADSLKYGRKVSISSDIGRLLITRLCQKGDGFLAIVRKYVGPRGEMSEQFDRKSGIPVSAYDLTWSYASFLSATHKRNTTCR
ncbi:MAG: glycoside hydrolase family 15 protein [Pseudomonadota bacterium]|nr:glycoside hydrolase family 15 protein [Pseudomonadota bacterium]